MSVSDDRAISAVENVVADRSDLDHAACRTAIGGVEVQRLVGRAVPGIGESDLGDRDRGAVGGAGVDVGDLATADEAELAALLDDGADVGGETTRLGAIDDDFGDRELVSGSPLDSK
jgi:hypothetical protein